MLDTRRNTMTTRRVLVGATLILLILTTATALTLQGESANVADGAAVMPQYDDSGSLLLPADYREWRLVGSSLGLSYSEMTPNNEMFNNTLMEPTAHEHFTRTGEFREGTMFVLMLHRTGESQLPQRQGRFAADVMGIEMAVKDSTHLAEGWGYYNFGGVNGVRDRVPAMPSTACYRCHAEHAQLDNVFMQFYPLLQAAASRALARGETLPATRPAAVRAAQTPAPSTPDARLAVRGLDPVRLVGGWEEMGKPEIEMTHEGYRYQFVSEPTRERFEAEPERFSISNDTCPVAPGVPLDPDLFVVHNGRIYGFADDACVATFTADPETYVP